jgi:hypothetical protein
MLDGFTIVAATGDPFLGSSRPVLLAWPRLRQAFSFLLVVESHQRRPRAGDYEGCAFLAIEARPMSSIGHSSLSGSC